MNRAALKQFAVRFSSFLTEQIRPLTGNPQETAHFSQLWFMRLTALYYLETNAALPRPLFSQAAPAFRSAVCSVCTELAGIPAFSQLFGENEDEFLPDSLLAPESPLHELPALLSSEQWPDSPEILGWLFQYRNTEEREDAFRKLRNHDKIPPEQIPAATQMFTPDWIVRCMVQNALSVLRTPDSGWQYVIPAAEQTVHARDRLKYLHIEKNLRDITVIDPCMGTGHILAYVFDALMDLYRNAGVPAEKAAADILEHNIFGLDIDENACALASFVLLMKAYRYDAGILQKDIRLKLYHFADMNIPADSGCIGLTKLAEQFEDARIFGSLLRPKMQENADIPEKFRETADRLQALCDVLTRRYDAVITNPPYMGSSSMNAKLSAFVRKHYPDSKSDLFAAFMERCAAMTAENGCFSMITQHSWMFLSSYETLRRKMLQGFTLRSMVHLGARAFAQTDVGTIVQTTAFTAFGSFVPDYRTTYLRLSEDEDKEAAFFLPDRRYICDISRFSDISGSPVCYWISDRMHKALQYRKLSELCPVRQGMTTSDNKRFLRLWHEIPLDHIAFGCRNAAEAQASGKRWFPYNKGGKFRKWYGNHTHVVDFFDNGAEMRAFHAMLNKSHAGGRIKNEEMYFRQAVTWPFITESTKFGVRFQPEGFLFDVAGSSLFPDISHCFYIMGFLGSKVALEILKLYNPTMNFQVENIGNLPLIFDEAYSAEVERLVRENIALARAEWDSYESSWDFRVHPLVRTDCTSLREAYGIWEKLCQRRQESMRRNEEKLNEIFIRIYGLEGELSPAVAPEEITLRKAELRADVKSFLSFAVGCIFGRYHLENAEFPEIPENFIPLPPSGPADILVSLEQFLTAVFGADTLEENLQFTADALGGGKDARNAISLYFSREFYADHCKIYKKRPLYWMADSGRRHGVRGLMYLHRMDVGQLPLLRSLADMKKTQNSADIRNWSAALSQEETKSRRSAIMRSIAVLETEQRELTEFIAEIGRLEKECPLLPVNDGVLRNYERWRKILAANR